MSYSLIQCQDLGLIFSKKICFSGFDAQVMPGARIGLMGNNGCGKSSLLKILAGLMNPTEGDFQITPGMGVAYVSQIIETITDKSGGERFQVALTNALVSRPNVLLLDEPTNHLDAKSRRNLMNLLDRFPGAIIFASHDTELLHRADTLWHMEQGCVHEIQGGFEAYMSMRDTHHQKREHNQNILKRAKKDAHLKRMKEQERVKKSRLHGEKKYAGDKLMLNAAKERGKLTMAKNHVRLLGEKNQILEGLADFRRPQRLVPTFSLKPGDIHPHQTILSIIDGVIGYESPLLSNITMTLQGATRLAICGNNGSGKTTLLKGILGQENVRKAGHWQTPSAQDMGYLDQHYALLDPEKTVLEVLAGHQNPRQHLNDFLFRTNEEVSTPVQYLSGGEKARLSLAVLAAHTPKLLILDEVTNNLDLETKGYVMDVLKAYPGALIVISHDSDFLESIDISEYFSIL